MSDLPNKPAPHGLPESEFSLEEQQILRRLEDEERDVEAQRLADRSDDEWWSDLTADDDGRLTKALDDLVKGGCVRSRVVSDLRELEGLSEGYAAFSRTQLKNLIAALDSAFDGLMMLELSQYYPVLPAERPDYTQIGRYADALRQLDVDPERRRQARLARLQRSLTHWVDKKIRPRGRVGKVRQHEALALLIGAAVRQKRSVAAQRVSTARQRPKQPRAAAAPKQSKRRGRPRKRDSTLKLNTLAAKNRHKRHGFEASEESEHFVASEESEDS